MAEYEGVFVFCEVGDGKLASITIELLGGGRKLADELEEGLFAVLIGSGVSELAQEVVAFGAEKVYVIDDPILKDYQTDSYVTAVEKVVNQAMPRIIMMGQTTIGRDLAPRLAFRLDTAATLDCVELAIGPQAKQLLQTKPVYGGNGLAVFTTEYCPQVVTIRVKAMSALERDDLRKGEIIQIEAGIDPAAIRTRVIEQVLEEVEGIKLEDAQVVIAGGRGIGSAEGFKELEGLARLLKGAVGASRPPCEKNWVPAGLQVGLTGKIVTPDLYVAVALSGSSQHMSGCSGAKNIVAINKDPEANIVKQASFAVIGDWRKVLPPFTNKVKEMLSD